VRDSRLTNVPPRTNAAPSLELLVIRQNHQTGERSLDLLKWGLIPYWCNDPKGGRKPINAKAETIASLPMFRDAYARRRCIVPIDGFFEWKAIKGQKARQPFAIAMKDGSPFGIAALCARSRSSPCQLTSLSGPFTTVCRRSCTGRTTIGGSGSSQIRTMHFGRSRLSF
jgi:putative SOS response-associated peptidase YedK